MEKMKRFSHYAMETLVQGVTYSTKSWLEDKFREHLEKNIHFTQKADILAFAFTSIDDKIKFVDQQIKDLQDYKKSLKSSSVLAKEIGASVLSEFGISKLEGSLFSSITISKAIKTSKLALSVEDEQALIDLGYYTKVLDEKAILSAYLKGTAEEVEELKDHCDFITVEKTTPAKLRINKKRSSNNDDYSNVDLNGLDGIDDIDDIA